MKTRALIIGLSLITAVAFAKDPRRNDLQAFAGNWKCSGNAFASPMSAAHPTTANVSSKWTLGDQWLEVRYTEDKTAKNPQPIDAALHMRYDEGLKKFVNVAADSMGGYGVQQSDGWKDGVMTLTGASHTGTMTMNVRDTFTKKGNDLVHVGEVQDKKGAWQKTDEETCKH